MKATIKIEFADKSQLEFDCKITDKTRNDFIELSQGKQVAGVNVFLPDKCVEIKSHDVRLSLDELPISGAAPAVELRATHANKSCFVLLYDNATNHDVVSELFCFAQQVKMMVEGEPKSCVTTLDKVRARLGRKGCYVVRVKEEELDGVSIAGYTHLSKHDQLQKWASQFSFTCYYDRNQSEYVFKL